MGTGVTLREADKSRVYFHGATAYVSNRKGQSINTADPAKAILSD